MDHVNYVNADIPEGAPDPFQVCRLRFARSPPLIFEITMSAIVQARGTVAQIRTSDRSEHQIVLVRACQVRRALRGLHGGTAASRG